MVKKLYKQEIRAWLRIMPIFFGVTLVTALFHRIFQIVENESVYYGIVNFSAIALFAVSCLVCLAAPIVFGIIRFYKNLFTGEGYLTFTLPVKNTTHILVKSTTTLLGCVAAWIICLLAGCIITAGDVLTEICKAAAYLWKLIPAKYLGHVWGWLAEMAVLLLVATFATIMLYNFCLCVGQMSKKNRILRSVGIYFACYILTQILGTVFIIFMTVADANGALVPVFKFIDKHPFATIHLGFGIGIVWCALLSLVFWLVCRVILRKKLNME